AGSARAAPAAVLARGRPAAFRSLTYPGQSAAARVRASASRSGGAVAARDVAGSTAPGPRRSVARGGRRAEVGSRAGRGDGAGRGGPRSPALVQQGMLRGAGGRGDGYVSWPCRVEPRTTGGRRTGAGSGEQARRGGQGTRDLVDAGRRNRALARVRPQ